MALTTLFLLSNVEHGVPSGNYDGSSQDFDSDGVKAVGYYQGQGGIQTLGMQVTGFQGLITLQATIDEEWQTANWFDLYTFGDPDTTTTEYRPYTATGNFTWVRARITDFSAGTINSIIITY